MSSRRERRMRAATRRESEASLEQTAPHNRSMAAVAIKRYGVEVEKADSKQLGETQDAFVDLYTSGKAIPPPLPLETLLGLKETNSIHSACIDAKVTDAVGRGWYLEAEDDDTEDEENAQRIAFELREWLRERTPRAPRLSFSKLCQAAVRAMDTTGWGAWEIGREGEEISNIWPLQAHTLRATKEEDVYVQIKGDKRVFYKAFGSERMIDSKSGEETGEGDATEILVFAHYTERSKKYGLPPWVACIPSIAEMTAIREYNVSWFESGGMCDRLIHVEGDEGESVRDSIHEQLESSKTIGHTTVVSNGATGTSVDVHLLSQKEGDRDSQFMKGREDLVKEILIAHQVPPYRVGWAELGSLGGSAAKEMIGTYRDGVVEPLQEVVEETLADTIFNAEAGGFDLGGYGLCFIDKDWDEEELNVEKARIAVESGMATPNDGREMLGLDRVDDESLDRYYYKGQPIGEGMTEATDVVREFKKSLDVVVRAQESQELLVVAGAPLYADDPALD